MLDGKTGPLQGIKVLEMPAIGPVPFCGMLLSDLGADILRLDRAEAADLGVQIEPRFDVLGRGKRSLIIDLKAAASRELVLRILRKADVVIEGFRPGTMEKLGLGPEEAFAVNPRLVYGRMTGWGQLGPLAKSAGHDINYLALTGALHAIGPGDGAPVPPLNLVADFGGGALYLAMGVLSALYEREKSGLGQVIDAAMVDGAASLMALSYGLLASEQWKDCRESNLLDGGAPWYRAYRCADGKYVALGALEVKFFRELMSVLGIDPTPYPNHLDPECWPALREVISEKLLTRTRDQWCAAVGNRDCCLAPVLSMTEAPHYAHTTARSGFVRVNDVIQPAVAPRFSRTVGAISRPPPGNGHGGEEALRDWQVEKAE